MDFRWIVYFPILLQGSEGELWLRVDSHAMAPYKNFSLIGEGDHWGVTWGYIYDIVRFVIVFEF